MSTLHHCNRCGQSHIHTEPCDPAAQLGVLGASFSAPDPERRHADAVETIAIIRWRMSRGRGPS